MLSSPVSTGMTPPGLLATEPRALLSFDKSMLNSAGKPSMEFDENGVGSAVPGENMLMDGSALIWPMFILEKAIMFPTISGESVEKSSASIVGEVNPEVP
ncbi:hypothetical protein PC116_g29680 [Phytophthora cactorum]|nr:hypothetical protein PC116_g29680 [Phytophthora cactorum]